MFATFETYGTNILNIRSIKYFLDLLVYEYTLVIDLKFDKSFSTNCTNTFLRYGHGKKSSERDLDFAILLYVTQNT